MDDILEDFFEITLFKNISSPIGLNWLDNPEETYLFAPKDQFVE